MWFPTSISIYRAGLTASDSNILSVDDNKASESNRVSTSILVKEMHNKTTLYVIVSGNKTCWKANTTDLKKLSLLLTLSSGHYINHGPLTKTNKYLLDRPGRISIAVTTAHTTVFLQDCTEIPLEEQLTWTVHYIHPISLPNSVHRRTLNASTAAIIC